jgi:hypothetical protein
MGTPVRVVVAPVVLALLGGGVWQLRSATMSTHVPIDPASRLAVTVDAESNQSETGQSLLEMVTAKVAMCRLEVRTSDPTGPLEPGPDGRFRFVLQPSLDDTDRVQFRGCLEDWNVDHLLLDVVEMREVAA